MALTPALDAANFLRSAKEVSVAVLAQPPPLTGPLTGLSASRLKTIALAIFSPPIRNEKLAATVAFTSSVRAAHRPPHFGAAPSTRKRKREDPRRSDPKKEEELYEEEREEKSTEEDGNPKRQLSHTFIPPLTL